MNLEQYRRFSKLQKQSRFYKKATLVLILILLFLISNSSNAAQCLKFSSEFTNESDGQDYIVYFADQYPLENCPYDGVLTTQEFVRYSMLEEQNGKTVEITSIEIAEAFTWGFGTYIFFWFLGYCIKNARDVIKSL